MRITEGKTLQCVKNKRTPVIRQNRPMMQGKVGQNAPHRIRFCTWFRNSRSNIFFYNTCNPKNDDRFGVSAGTLLFHRRNKNAAHAGEEHKSLQKHAKRHCSQNTQRAFGDRFPEFRFFLNFCIFSRF